MRTFGLVALWFFFLENVWFPNQHQEYGVRALQAYDSGRPEAEPILLQFAADQLGVPVGREAVVNFALPIADWVYPVWGLVAAALVLVIARRTIDRPWAATVVAGGYVAYRCLIWPALAGIDFPKSAVPLFLILVGLAIDAAHVVKMPTPAAAVLGSAAITTVGYVGIWAQQEYLWAPPIAFASAAVTAVLLAVAVDGRRHARPPPRGPLDRRQAQTRLERDEGRFRPPEVDEGALRRSVPAGQPAIMRPDDLRCSHACAMRAPMACSAALR